MKNKKEQQQQKQDLDMLTSTFNQIIPKGNMLNTMY